MRGQKSSEKSVMFVVLYLSIWIDSMPIVWDFSVFICMNILRQACAGRHHHFLHFFSTIKLKKEKQIKKEKIEKGGNKRKHSLI